MQVRNNTAGGISIGLRVAPHIGIRVHPCHVPLHCIGRQEHAHHRVVVACIVVIQSGERVIVLTREAFGRAVRPLVVALLAIGSIHLVAFDGRAACRVAQVRHDAAQQVGLVERGTPPIRFAHQMPGQRVVVGVALVAACAGVAVLLAPEGIDRQAGVAAIG